MKKSINGILALGLLINTAEAATALGLEMDFYGFLKTSANYSTSALASFNNINHSAPTHAVAQTRPQDETSRFNFQAQQTRFGSNLKKGNVSGKIEFDFVDFSKASPSTQMVPRVRIASITYQMEDLKIILGQDWDLFSPVNTITYNHVGGYFLAGNTGFMRHQAQVLKKSGEWETGAAIGMATSNATPIDTDLEQGKSPTYAVRLLRNLKEGRIGVSAIYATLDWETSNNMRRDAYGYNIFYEKKYGQLSIKTEAYYGQSLNNLGTLSLGRGTNTKDVREWGGHVTGIYPISESANIFAGAGLARIDNKSEMLPYELSTTTRSISYPGVRSNLVTRAGYEKKISPELSWYTEVSRYETDSKIRDNKYETVIAHQLESGLQLRF